MDTLSTCQWIKPLHQEVRFPHRRIFSFSGRNDQGKFPYCVNAETMGALYSHRADYRPSYYNDDSDYPTPLVISMRKYVNDLKQKSDLLILPPEFGYQFGVRIPHITPDTGPEALSILDLVPVFVLQNAYILAQNEQLYEAIEKWCGNYPYVITVGETHGLASDEVIYHFVIPQ